MLVSTPRLNIKILYCYKFSKPLIYCCSCSDTLKFAKCVFNRLLYFLFNDCSTMDKCPTKHLRRWIIISSTIFNYILLLEKLFSMRHYNYNMFILLERLLKYYICIGKPKISSTQFKYNTYKSVCFSLV